MSFKHTFGVMSFGPVVAGSRLSEDKVVGAEDLAISTTPHGVHGARFKIHQDCLIIKNCKCDCKYIINPLKNSPEAHISPQRPHCSKR